MEFYTEPEHKLPVTDHADVIVAGAGPAGYTAAIAAARTGAKTILVEQFNCVGGMDQRHDVSLHRLHRLACFRGDDGARPGGKSRNLLSDPGRGKTSDQP